MIMAAIDFFMHKSQTVYWVRIFFLVFKLNLTSRSFDWIQLDELQYGILKIMLDFCSKANIWPQL